MPAIQPGLLNKDEKIANRVKKAMSSLNANAAPFVPSYSSISTDGTEDHLTQEDLDELEAAEQWVQQLVNLEEDEAVFMMDMALDGTPSEPTAAPQQQQLKAPAAVTAADK